MFIIGLILVSRFRANRIFVCLVEAFWGRRAYLLVISVGRGETGGLVALVLCTQAGQGDGEVRVLVSWQTAAFSPLGAHLQQRSWKLGVIFNYSFLQSWRLRCCVNGIRMYAGCMCHPEAVSGT